MPGFIPLFLFWFVCLFCFLFFLSLPCTVSPVQQTISMWIKKSLSLCVSIWFHYCEWSENGARPEPAASLLPTAESSPGTVPSPRLPGHVAPTTPGR